MYLLQLDLLIEAWPAASGGEMREVLEFPQHILDKGSLKTSEGCKLTYYMPTV